MSLAEGILELVQELSISLSIDSSVCTWILRLSESASQRTEFLMNR